MTIEYQSAEEMLASYAERRARLRGTKPPAAALSCLAPFKRSEPIAKPVHIPAPVRARFIIRDVAAKHDIDAASIMSRSRLTHIVIARHEIFYRLHSELGYPFYRIARLFGMDHTSVMGGVARHKERMAAANG